MALLLNSHDVERLLPMGDAIDALENAFRQWGEQRVKMPPRHVIEVVPSRAFALFMPAFLPESQAIGIKIVSLFKDNPAAHKLPSILAAGVLLDERTGAVKCLMDAASLTAIRTAAVSGLATRYLARDNAQCLAMIGSGVQSVSHIRAMREVRPVARVRVYSPNLASKWASFLQANRETPHELLEQARSAAEALEGADLVCLATTASRPVISFEELEPGVHLNVVGSHTPEAREVDSETIVRSRVVCESVEACLAEAGDLIVPVEEGCLSREEVYTGLADVVLGRQPARQSETEITLFKSTGLAFEDVALMALVYQRARAGGVGAEFNFSG